MKKNKKAIGYLLSAIVSLTVIASIFYPTKGLNSTIINSETTNLAANIDLTKDYLYLSDLDYITENNWSYNGWGGHELQKDKNQDGGILSLIINGEKRLFAKGLGVHAKGQVTFDISEYSTQFPRFIAKIGVDASRGKNGSIWFRITASKDGITWDRLIDKTSLISIKTEKLISEKNIKIIKDNGIDYLLFDVGYYNGSIIEKYFAFNEDTESILENPIVVRDSLNTYVNEDDSILDIFYNSEEQVMAKLEENVIFALVPSVNKKKYIINEYRFAIKDGKFQKELIKTFGSVAKMRNASISELSKIIPENVAINLKTYLNSLKEQKNSK